MTNSIPLEEARCWLDESADGSGYTRGVDLNTSNKLRLFIFTFANDMRTDDGVPWAVCETT